MRFMYSRLKMSPWVLISSCSTDRLRRCNLSSDTSLKEKFRMWWSVMTLTSRTHSHPWPAPVWRLSSSSRRCRWPPAPWGSGASWRRGRAPGTDNHHPPPSLESAFTQLVIPGHKKTIGFYLSCNIFCLNLKWSSRDFSFSLSFFFLLRVFVRFDDESFFFVEELDSWMVVRWDLSWLVAFKSLISSEGLSLLKLVLWTRKYFYQLLKYIYIKSAKKAS